MTEAELLAERLAQMFNGPAEVPKPTVKIGPSGIRIHNCIQGTTAWLEARAGIPTASCFDKIVTPGGKKGPQPSAQAEKYMFRLLAERMMGHPVIEKPMSHWMDRGSEYEAEAVQFYELQRDCATEKVGFITNAAATIGCSPDRLCGDDGLVEIKVPAEHTHVGYLLQAGSAYEEYKIQVQGQMMIVHRKWVDVLSFHPEMPPALTRIERDDDFIRQIQPVIVAFSNHLEMMTRQLVEKGWISKENAARYFADVDSIPF